MPASFVSSVAPNDDEAAAASRPRPGVDVAAETSTRPAKYANKQSTATSMVKVETCFSFTPRLGGTSIRAAGRTPVVDSTFLALPIRRVRVLVRGIVFSIRKIQLQLWRLPGFRGRRRFRTTPKPIFLAKAPD